MLTVTITDEMVKAGAKALAKRFKEVNAPRVTNLGWKDFLKESRVVLEAALNS